MQISILYIFLRLGQNWYAGVENGGPTNFRERMAAVGSWTPRKMSSTLRAVRWIQHRRKIYNIDQLTLKDFEGWLPGPFSSDVHGCTEIVVQIPWRTREFHIAKSFVFLDMYIHRGYVVCDIPFLALEEDHGNVVLGKEFCRQWFRGIMDDEYLSMVDPDDEQKTKKVPSNRKPDPGRSSLVTKQMLRDFGQY